VEIVDVLCGAGIIIRYCLYDYLNSWKKGVGDKMEAKETKWDSALC
jgi:hypothetical protein